MTARQLRRARRYAAPFDRQAALSRWYCARFKVQYTQEQGDPPSSFRALQQPLPWPNRLSSATELQGSWARFLSAHSAYKALSKNRSGLKYIFNEYVGPLRSQHLVRFTYKLEVT